MPNYIIFNPNSTPVPNLVIGIRLSWPEERENELGSFVKDPSLDGVDREQEMLVDSGNIRNLTQGEKDSITAAAVAANAALALAQKPSIKQAAKNIFVTPTGPQQIALKLAFDTVLRDIFLPEINAVRTNAGLVARTENQLNTAFRNAYIVRVDAL